MRLRSKKYTAEGATVTDAMEALEIKLQPDFPQARVYTYDGEVRAYTGIKTKIVEITRVLNFHSYACRLQVKLRKK